MYFITHGPVRMLPNAHVQYAYDSIGKEADPEDHTLIHRSVLIDIGALMLDHLHRFED